MIKSMTAAAVIWLVITCAFPLYAQRSKSTLGDLWPGVEESYPGVEAQKSAEDAARLQEESVKGSRLPQVKAQAQNT